MQLHFHILKSVFQLCHIVVTFIYGFLWQARHGTRAPTKKKLKQLEALSTRLQFLLQNVEEEKKSLHNIPAWLSGWKSPWKGKHKGGELISEGEAEMYELGIRIREKFPELFKEEYHPDIYPIKTTQVRYL